MIPSSAGPGYPAGSYGRQTVPPSRSSAFSRCVKHPPSRERSAGAGPAGGNRPPAGGGSRGGSCTQTHTTPPRDGAASAPAPARRHPENTGRGYGGAPGGSPRPGNRRRGSSRSPCSPARPPQPGGAPRAAPASPLLRPAPPRSLFLCLFFLFSFCFVFGFFVWLFFWVFFLSLSPRSGAAGGGSGAGAGGAGAAPAARGGAGGRGGSRRARPWGSARPREGRGKGPAVPRAPRPLCHFPVTMDTGSLDTAVQGALQALYPPFEATAPTVLGQVFRLLETSYQGDGLCCLLQFLIPAKRLFEHVRQAACAPYFNCIFLHEGWPLCLHEKVVVHLAPLNPLLLRPGDFYLQAEPCQEHSARITVKHLSCDLRTVEETPVPEAAYALLFTNEWLEEINGDRAGDPLHTCLVATENGIAPLPWSKIATPEFVEKPKAGADVVSAGDQHGPAPESTTRPAACSIPTPRGTVDTPAPYSNVAGTIPGCKVRSWKSSQGRYPGLIKVDQAGLRKQPSPLAMPSLCEIISQNLEGEYVDLRELSQEQLELLARSLPPTCLPGPTSAGAGATLPWTNGELGTGTRPHGGTLSLEEGPCTPCRGTKLSQEPHGPRCRHRDSYLAALQNPVSFGPGLMAAILEEPDSPSPELPSTAPRQTPAPRRREAGSPLPLTHHPHPASPEAVARQGSSRLPPGSGHKFSFLKGPRLGVAPRDERATSQHEGAWKKVSAIYSPRMGRAKPGGKGTQGVAVRAGALRGFVVHVQLLSLSPRAGTDTAAAATLEEQSPKSTGCKNGPSTPGTGNAVREPPGWQELHTGLLRSGIVCLPGSSDRLGRTLLQVTTSGSAWGAKWCSATELARLILYFCSLPRGEAKDGGITVLVDARKQPPAPVLFSALRSVQSISRGCIHTVLLLAEKELVTPRERLPGVQVETLASLKALGRYIDSSQLTPELEGTFPYCHGEWVQFFQKLHPFTAGLRRASELLRSCIQELRSAGTLAGTQDVSACIGRQRELMRRVLSDPQLVQVQREGGAVLARLRREAARLGPSPGVRASMDSAEELYSQLEEELHDLVSQSNSCLERLEFLQKIRELEAEFGKLGGWLDGEAAVQLQEMGTKEQSLKSVQGSEEHFNEFLIQAMAQYWRGLALCQEAAEVQDAAFPEADPFQKAAALFRRKLLRFLGQVERRRAERELLQELGRFSSKVSGLKVGCRQCSGRGPCGEGQALQCLQSSFQTLSVELALEKLQEMEAQVCRMQSSQELAAWTQARHSYHESRQILEEMLAELQEAWGAQADGPGAAPLCHSAVPQGTVPSPGTQRSTAEATQYFQVSSQSSFSSEDSDSQNSTEDVPAASLALPRDLQGPRPSCLSEKPSQIVYLENHHTNSPAKANTK
ncbi:uncharacterized protein KIAA1755 homolog isoform X2 [Heliangelus exortis]|uniref:uncharacterized protein KIAA1755 homolog isoform X2 n=1 Tax=Heliangelus exortis TaxID=472823 RepID=UPI003A8F3481